MNYHIHHQRVLQVALASTALFLFAACSASTTTAPSPTVRGVWTRPSFPSVSLPTLSSVAFADTNQRDGYACSSTLKQAGSPTPVATDTGTGTAVAATTTPSATNTLTPTSSATPTTSPGVTPTPTLNIPGRPTPIAPPTAPAGASQQTIENAFWATTNGGQTWQTATLPSDLTSLLCPVSAIVVTAPNTVYFLAAQGTIDINNPTSVAPGQLQYQLYQSNDGAKTWKKLTLPATPNVGTAVAVSPYHLIIQAKGQNLTFATNGSNTTALFTSTDGGQSWTSHSANELTGTTDTTATVATEQFASFAAGVNGNLLALSTNPTTAATTAPYTIWQSTDSAVTWKRISTPALNIGITAASHAQLFAAPNGSTVYLVTQQTSNSAISTTTPVIGSTPYQPVALFQSKDGGVTWGTNIWPTNAGKPLGGSNIVTIGANFTVAATGDAYFAPTRSDDPAVITDTAILSAGIYSVTNGLAKQVSSPLSDANTVIGLTVSQAALSDVNATVTTTTTASASTPVATTPITPTVTSTATAQPTVTSTLVAGTPTTSTPVTSTATATSVPIVNNPTDLPVLWTNFGPISLLTTKPDAAGFFFNDLP